MPGAHVGIKMSSTVLARYYWVAQRRRKNDYLFQL
jgi:hypothetical protein